MGKNSGIEWTHHSFNPHWGCVRVSPGCENCYAETFSHRLGFNAWGAKGERREFGDEHWAEPNKWNMAAKKAGERRRVFCASMADVFEDHQIAARSRDRLWPLIAATPSLDWLLLTKRPENMIRFHPHPWAPNEWTGCTVEDQQRANERIPRLLSVPSFVRFLSVEPMLGPINLNRIDATRAGWRAVNGFEEPTAISAFETWQEYPTRALLKNGVHWVICGGESGNGSRPMSAMWARSLRDQCVSAGVAFHFKQWGQHTDAGSLVRRKHDAGRRRSRPGHVRGGAEAHRGWLHALARFRRRPMTPALKCHDCTADRQSGHVRCDKCHVRHCATSNAKTRREKKLQPEPMTIAPVKTSAWLAEQDRRHGFDYRRNLRPRAPEKAPPGPIEGVTGYVERLPSYARAVVIERREMPSLVSF